MKSWITADLHIGHKNILKYQFNRFLNWPNIEAHDQYLIDFWKLHVGDDDSVYHVGDFSLFSHNKYRAILDELPGRAIHLFAGNHDEKALGKLQGKLDNRFTIYDMAPRQFRFKDRVVLIGHYPLDDWEGKDDWDGVIHLHGHTHGSSGHGESGRVLGRIDIGWDAVNDFVDADVLIDRLEQLKS